MKNKYLNRFPTVGCLPSPVPKRVLAISIVIFLVIVMFVFNYPFKVVKTFNAIEIKMLDAEYIVDRELTFMGEYHINIFDNDVFTGRIIISGYEQTYNVDKMGSIGIKSNDTGWPILFRAEDSKNRLLDSYIFGFIFSKRFLREVIIIPSAGYSYADATCIVANATTREEAVALAEKIL